MRTMGRERKQNWETENYSALLEQSIPILEKLNIFKKDPSQ